MQTCKNCGGAVASNYCPDCGQSIKTAIPTILECVKEAFSAFFSYDHRLWRTLGLLAKRPGQATLDYIEGRRVQNLAPFQLFLWVQALAFLCRRQFFGSDPGEAERLTLELAIVAAFIALMLGTLFARHKFRIIVHITATIHIWTFLMLFLLVEYALSKGIVNLLAKLHILNGTVYLGLFVTHSSEAVLFFYLAFAIRRIYGVSLAKGFLNAGIISLCYYLLVYCLPFAFH